LRRAAAALRSAGEAFELVVVDDASADGTADRVESLAHEIPARVLRRPGRLGLATAVLDGWAMARGDVWGVMDATWRLEAATCPAAALQIGRGCAALFPVRRRTWRPPCCPSCSRRWATP